ncbi:hypothetical protein M0Q50_07380 [bacterium]|jgi:hypothetical protein|nr:hypothetical protein [bacterium]
MKINDIVFCINNTSKHYTLTLYKEYKIIDIEIYFFNTEIEIQILDDDLFNIWVSSKRFCTKYELRLIKLNTL